MSRQQAHVHRAPVRRVPYRARRAVPRADQDPHPILPATCRGEWGWATADRGRLGDGVLTQSSVCVLFLLHGETNGEVQTQADH